MYVPNEVFWYKLPICFALENTDHPQTKLWEGNVFTGICHSFREGGWGGVGTLHVS